MKKRIIKGRKAWTGLFLFDHAWSWCRPVNRRFKIGQDLKYGWISFLIFGVKWSKGLLSFRFLNKQLKLVYK